jgi:outer membrane protein insertion porin family
VLTHDTQQRALTLGWLGLVLMLGAGFTPDASAQQDPLEGLTIDRVEIRGLESLGEGYVRRILRTRAGEEFSREDVETDIRELLRTRKFVNVFAEPTQEADRVVVAFVLREKPALNAVIVSGNSELSDSDIYDVLPAPGAPIDRYEIDRARDEVLRLYQEDGYYYATVTLDENALERRGELILNITEGPRVRVRKITYEGSSAFTKFELDSRVRSQTYIPIFQKGALDEEQIERDALSIAEFYRGEGYLDVQVDYQLDIDEVDRSDVFVRFVIIEGPRYDVQEVAINGNTAFTTDELLAEVSLLPGEIFRQEVNDADVRRLQNLYGEIGYIDAQIGTAYDFLDKPGVVRVRYEIRENKRSRVGRITIRGNRMTQDRVIRRALQVYPGDDFNLLLTKRSEQRLRETQLFTSATITPLEEDADGYREALVEVEEADAIFFLFGAGVSTDSGLLGSFSIQHRNFDLFDWPENWEELVRGRAFRGAGQRLRLQAEPGTELTRFRIDFTEPYLFDLPYQLGTSFYLWQRGRESYDEERLGFTVSLGRRFESGPLEGWAVEGAFKLENVGVDSVDAIAPREVREVKGDNTLASGKFSIVRDTTDSIFLPSEGYRLNLSWEQFGGDFSFGKPSAGFAWYRTLATDVLDRKSVLALRADVGYLTGDTPTFERFYGGGLGSLRGFRFRGVSPRNGIRDDPIGGEFVLVTRGEYSFPVYGENIRGVTFLDMGTVEKDVTITTWRAAVGFGLRVYVDFFGPAPMIFDFAFPIAEDKEDQNEVFNFSFGASF